VHLSSQLAFNLDTESAVPPSVMARPPQDLPDQDRAAAVAQLALLIARYHAAGGSVDDDE
jgi:hypothetical protein